MGNCNGNIFKKLNEEARFVHKLAEGGEIACITLSCSKFRTGLPT